MVTWREISALVVMTLLVVLQFQQARNEWKNLKKQWKFHKAIKAMEKTGTAKSAAAEGGEPSGGGCCLVM